ncbi:MAG: ATP-dependent RecD-like DNA helicase [Verrucomicrobiota bacterium]
MSSHLPDPEEIQGLVHSIVFHNEENGYTIMQVEVAGDSPITVLGNLPAVVQGERIKARGKWKNNRRFGKQFEAEHISAIAPNSDSGIRRFLASGLIDGIGKTYAKRMVDHFGTDTFRIIEEESRRLEEVEGIGQARRIKIRNSWKRQKSVRDIMIFLHEHGLSTARALRLHKIYGEEAVNVLRSDPYRLAHEIPGVGFKTADQIATQMGQDPGSQSRLRAGILYALELAERQGHCALPRKVLVKEALKLLEGESSSIKASLNQLILKSELVAEGDSENALIFPRDLHEAEQKVAADLLALAAKPTTLPAVKADQALAWFERHHDIALDEEQAKTVIEATRHRVFVITGGPGVGKTTILNALLEILSAKKVTPILAAPTGRAAKRLSEGTRREALTLHRLLEYQPESGFTRNRSHSLEGDFFVIDEASMVDLRLMAALVEAIPEDGNLLLVGDVDQLPSVGPGSVLRDLISSEVVPVSRLTRIYRQGSRSLIVDAAHEINQGQLPPLESKAEADFFFIERKDPAAIRDTLAHLIQDRIPGSFSMNPRDDLQVLTPMNRQSLGTSELNHVLQETLNPPAELKLEIERFGVVFRQGDKVIQTRNNYEKEVFNGDIGHIVEITTEPSTITVSFDHRSVTYEPGELDELQLAYAITIHKSQGSEFPAVIIPLSTQHFMLLQRNLLYTGVTRGRKLVVLVGERKALEMAIRNERSARRYTGLADRLKQ